MLNLSNLFNLGKISELSKNTGISTGNLCDWKSGRSKPSAETLIKIAEQYNCSIDYLLGKTDNPNILTNTKIYRFPVYNQEAAAGVGRLGRDSNYDMEEYMIDNIPDEAIFAMKISGESMYSEKTDYLIRTDSIVLINSKDFDYDLNNKIVIVNFKGQVICKRYVDKREYVLFQSDNLAFENENRKSSDDPECKIIGVVLGVIENKKFIEVY